MGKIITQETFNDAVKENMSLFGLEGAQAIRETVDQFRMQGVDLSNIIKEEWGVLGGEDPLSTAIGNLGPGSTTRIESMKELTGFCVKDISFRLRAAELGAYSKLIEILNVAKGEEVGVCLDAVCSIMEGYPDLLDEEGEKVMFKMLMETQMLSDENNLTKVLEWARRCCLKHERNRKRFMDKEIDQLIKVILERNALGKDVIQGCCGVVASLTLDDDIREAVSGSHIHACTLANSVLQPLMTKLWYQTDGDCQASLLRAIASILVRDTICQQFVDFGGLPNLVRLLNTNPSQKVLLHGFNVLSCLAGRDEIKDDIVKSGLGPLIATSLWRGQDVASLCTAGLALVARLCLRSPTNSRTLYNVGLGDCIVHIMRIHPNEERLQSSGCLAVRNMVSHCPDLRPGLLSLGFEKSLEQLPKRFPNLADNCKATLLALDCKVHLKEEWTGIHGDRLKADT